MLALVPALPQAVEVGREGCGWTEPGTANYSCQLEARAYLPDQSNDIDPRFGTPISTFRAQGRRQSVTYSS